MKSVTYIIGQLVLGGAEKQLYLLVKGLVNRGYKVNVITLHGGHEDFWEKPIRDLGVEVFEVNTSSRIIAILKILDFIRKNPTEIIHSWSSYTGLYALLVAFLTHTHLCIGSQRSTEKYIIHELGFFFYWLSYKGFRGITVNSRYGMLELQKRWPQKKIYYIPNAIDTTKNTIENISIQRKLLREVFNIPDDLFLIGSIGLMVQVKRFDLIIDAIKIIQENGYKCGLFIIGDGPLKTNLVNKAKTHLQPGTFFFPGSMSEADKYIPMFDLFSLTSEYEGTPNVIMEALASRSPVISTNVGDINALIQNGISGVILESSQPEHISVIIQELIDNPDLRLRLSQNGFDDIKKQFETNLMVDKMVSSYCDMEKHNH